jgi:hypothetical protein
MGGEVSEGSTICLMRDLVFCSGEDRSWLSRVCTAFETARAWLSQRSRYLFWFGLIW